MIEDFAVADERLFQALLSRSTELSCAQGRALFRQGEFPDGLFLIHEGEASLLLLSPADRIISSFRAGPGCVLGLAAVVELLPHTLSANVRRGSKAGFVQMEEFRRLLDDDPSLFPSMLRLLASEVRIARAALQEAIADTAPHRSTDEEACSEVHWEYLAAK